MHALVKLLPVAAAAALLAGPTAASAQTPTTDARWQPWVGCWQPSVATPLGFGNDRAAAPVVCVIPAGGTAVDVATISHDSVVSRERVDAGGARVTSTQDGCDGWRSGRWSPDGTRVYLKSEYACAGSARRASTGLLAISADGELLDVERVGVDSHSAVRTLRYRPAAIPATLAAAIPASVGWHVAGDGARIAAGAPVSLDDVKEVAAAVDGSVLEAWIVERNEPFQLGARQLVSLADAGVPARTIDVMVALSYPKVFALNAPPRSGAVETDGRTIYGTFQPTYGSGYGDGYYGWNSYSAFGAYPYGAYNGYGNGYGAYGYGAGWYPPSGPVIVVRSADAPHGRIEKGRGYTRGGDGGAADVGATPRTSSGSGSSGSTASSPPPSAPAAPAAEPSGRTAKPRP